MKLSHVLLLVLLLHLVSFAAPHFGESFDLGQPDGSKVSVLVWGDEYYQRVESVDGYTLMRDSLGWICYATLNNDSSDFVSTGVVYKGTRNRSIPDVLKKGLRLSYEGRKGKVESSELYKRNRGAQRSRSQNESEESYAPVVGSVKGLTILVDFSDQSSSVSQSKLADFVNKPGYTGDGCNGSVRDYYYDVSGGKLTYTNIVTIFYRPKYPKSYYDENVMNSNKAPILIKEVLQGVQSQVDFSQLTRGSDGAIMALNVLYAGSPTWGWAKGLWPHQSQLGYYKVGNYTFNRYQMTSIGTSTKLTTFCHENGHMVGKWDDLYDYQRFDNTKASGIGDYGLMCSMGDAKNPVPPNAYYRSLVGWDDLEDITDAAQGTLCTTTSNSNRGYKYRNKNNSDELFVIESRERTGRNASLPGAGLLIWHIDEGGHNDYEQMTSSQHYYISLEQADGDFDLERNSGYYGDSQDPFYEGHNSTFNDQTLPNGKWWNGSSSSIDIANISVRGTQMTFTIGDFVAPQHTITASSSSGGSITPTGPVAVTEGQNKTFSFSPNSGYTVGTVTVDGVVVSETNGYTFSNVITNHTIHAAFQELKSVQVQTPNGGETLALGSSTSISWTASGLSPQAVATVELVEGTSNRVVEVLAEDVMGSTFTWDIPNSLQESTQYKIKVSSAGETDLSDQYFTIKEIIISANLTSFGDWYVINDEYTGANASTATLDTSNHASRGEVGGSFTIGQLDEASDIYPWASLVGEVIKEFTDVSGILLTYKCDKDYVLALDQEVISETGESYVTTLSASSGWTSVVIPLSAFAQPDWVTSATSLDLSKCKSLSFSVKNLYGVSSNIQVKNLQLLDYNADPEALLELADTAIILGDYFSRILPKGLFRDVDDSLLDLIAEGLPEGLEFSGEEIFGRPTTLGQSVIKIIASDKKNRKAEAGFTLEVRTVTAILKTSKNGGKQNFVIYPSIVKQGEREVGFVVGETISGAGVISVVDPVGNIIDHQSVSVENGGSYSWDLKNGDGVQVAPGTYAVYLTLKTPQGRLVRVKRMVGVRR